jgi:hypothetical protein
MNKWYLALVIESHLYFCRFDTVFVQWGSGVVGESVKVEFFLGAEKESLVNG